MAVHPSPSSPARPATGSIRTGLSAGWAATLAVLGWMGVYVFLALSALALVGVVAASVVRFAMDELR